MASNDAEEKCVTLTSSDEEKQVIQDPYVLNKSIVENIPSLC